MGRLSTAVTVVLLLATVLPLGAQAPPPTVLPGAPLPVPSAPPPPPAARPPVWTGSIGLGIAVTSGNTDTSTLNVSVDLSSRADARNVFKGHVLYLRGERDGELNLNRLSLRARDEYTPTPHGYTFGQVEYLRDTFKDVQYLVAPSVGLGYKAYDTPARALAFDIGVGVKVEKDMASDARASGAVTASQRWHRQLSSHATVTQSLAALWAADRFGDALYTFKVGLTADLTRRSQVKIEVVDLYKTRPPSATVVKNDVSAVTAVVYKF